MKAMYASPSNPLLMLIKRSISKGLISTDLIDHCYFSLELFLILFYTIFNLSQYFLNIIYFLLNFIYIFGGFIDKMRKITAVLPVCHSLEQKAAPFPY